VVNDLIPPYGGPFEVESETTNPILSGEVSLEVMRDTGRGQAVLSVPRLAVHRADVVSRYVSLPQPPPFYPLTSLVESHLILIGKMGPTGPDEHHYTVLSPGFERHRDPHTAVANARIEVKRQMESGAADLAKILGALS
jgi:hypothetical protein